MNAQTTESRDSRTRRNNGWKWAAAIAGGLIILALTCVISSVWGGLLGYALGRRSAYRMMMPEMPFESPYPPVPEMPDIPDIPELPEMPYLAGRPWLGVTFVMTGEGALITDVTPGSPADEEGLEPDDVITAVEGRAVSEAQPLDELILGYDPGDRVDLTVVREGRERTVRVRLASWMQREMPWQPEPSPFYE
ncbi:MAG: PDZ domain-containing protein, partial [Anaerolineae bacterium]|nr:PDZ domain-containing protein [Anaerolineae bacterium]